LLRHLKGVVRFDAEVKYSTTAKDLGLGLDEWPLFLETQRQAIRANAAVGRGNVYRQGRDLVLHVLNCEVIISKVWSGPYREKVFPIVVS